MDCDRVAIGAMVAGRFNARTAVHNKLAYIRALKRPATIEHRYAVKSAFSPIWIVIA